MRRPIRKRLFVASALAGMAFSLASAPAMAAGELVIRDFVLTHGVYEREPVGTTDSFMVDDQKAFAFVRINNEGEPTRVKFVWRYFGEEHASIPMNVGQSAGWRTWSSINLRPGDWSVQVVSDDGVILAQRSFAVSTQAAGGGSDSMKKDTASEPMTSPSTSSSDSMTSGQDG